MTPVDNVKRALEARGSVIAKDRGDDFMAQCPAHDDGNPSLHVSADEEGNALLRCFAECDVADILTALDMTLPELFADYEAEKEQPRPVPSMPAKQVDWYDYVDAEGNRLYQVVRFEPKTFRQRRWEDGRWQWGLGDTRRVLYHLPQLKATLARNEVVFVVEGEKDVHAVESAGYTATTSAGGVGGPWIDEYTETFGIGARVVVIADDDEPGRKRAADIARRLYGKVGRVVTRLPAEGFKDIHDHLMSGATMQQLRPLPVLSESNGVAHPDAGAGSNGSPAASNGKSSGAHFATARVFAARPSLGKALQVVGPMFQRGMRTTIGAQTGDGKTTFALQAINSLITGEPFIDETWKPMARGRALIVDLEQGEETLKLRLNDSGLDTSDAVDVLWEPAGLALDSDAEHQALIRDTIKEGGYDLVLLDPLYQMHQGSENDQQLAASLMRLVDEWARDLNFSLVIPMHARKPHPQAGTVMSINEIAGVTTWNRNAEFVFGLSVVNNGFSKLWTFKDRIGDGPPARTWWGLSFDREGGFRRNHIEDKQKKAAEAKAARAQTIANLTALLDTENGITRESLMAAADGDEVAVKAALKDAHEQAGRWRNADWQAGLM